MIEGRTEILRIRMRPSELAALRRAAKAERRSLSELVRSHLILPVGRPRKGKSRAFTLIELLVAVSVCAVLVGILIPTLAKSREEARKARCLSDLKNLAVPVAFYVDTYRKLPAVMYAPDELHLFCPSARDPDTKEYRFPVGIGTSSMGPSPATTWFGRIQSQDPSKVPVVGCLTVVVMQPRHDRFRFGYLDGGSR